MTAVLFDTYAVMKRRQASRFSAQQAEAVTSVLQEVQQVSLENLATKQELRELGTSLQHDIKESEAVIRWEIKEWVAAMQRDMQALAATTQRDIKALETTTQQDIQGLRRDMKELETVLRKDIDVKLSDLKADLMKWTVGMLLARIAVVAALVKLL